MIYVGTGGDVAIMLVGGDIILLAAIPTGTLLPLRAVKVFLTGTTASNLVGLY